MCREVWTHWTLSLLWHLKSSNSIDLPIQSQVSLKYPELIFIDFRLLMQCRIESKAVRDSNSQCHSGRWECRPNGPPPRPNHVARFWTFQLSTCCRFVLCWSGQTSSFVSDRKHATKKKVFKMAACKVQEWSSTFVSLVWLPNSNSNKNYKRPLLCFLEPSLRSQEHSLAWTW